jgi:predicted DNA-binding transcriptional regulator YafY
MTASELAEELEVSERTIYRDLEALNAAGVPVLAERGPGGGCELPENYRTNLTGLSESEVRGLFLSAVPGPLADLGMGKSIEAALRKLTAALPAAHREGLEQVRERIHVDTSEWFQAEEPLPHLDCVEQAVWQSRQIDITYMTMAGSRIRRCLEPYGLVAKGTVWYVVGGVAEGARVFKVAHIKPARRTMQVYRVSRIQSARLLESQFERPQDFDLKAYWDEWCAEFQSNLPKYHVTLRVAQFFTPVLPRLYGEGVRALVDEAGQADEDGWTTLNLTFDSFEAARSSVLGMGTAAEVLDPPELRSAVLEMASEVVDFYQRERRARNAKRET